MLFFLLINLKMPTIVGILIFMSRKISCSNELSRKKSFITSGPDLGLYCFQRYSILKLSDTTSIFDIWKFLVSAFELRNLYYNSQRNQNTKIVSFKLYHTLYT